MSVYSRQTFLHNAFFRVVLLCGILPTFLSCSSTKIVNPKDPQTHKPDFTLISTGKGPHLSEGILKNLSSRELNPARIKLLEFDSPLF